jgi:6-phosphogluconolactonase
MMRTQQPNIKLFDAMEWPLRVAELIQDKIEAILVERGRCSVMLTGGRSAERIYSAWTELPSFRQVHDVQFYFGDERCVPPDHPESNYGMVMRTLFYRGVPAGCSVLRMEADDSDRQAASQRYSGLLPNQVDVLLLGVGEDGHIASLFPGGLALHEVGRRVLAVVCPKPPYDRLTITPSVIAQAGSVFVLAAGVAKSNVLTKALQEPSDFDTMPARLVLGANWLMDTAFIHDDMLDDKK